MLQVLQFFDKNLTFKSFAKRLNEHLIYVDSRAFNLYGADLKT
jgi:hypothetical protein